MLAPPWTLGPDWWSLNGTPIRVTVPATTSLVVALAVPDDKGSTVWTMAALTDPVSHPDLLAAIQTGGPAVDRLLDDVADTLIERLTGWKRWEAAFVWQHTLGAWPAIDGEHLGRGVDLTLLPAGRATNAVYAWWRKALAGDEKAAAEFDRDMRREPMRELERQADVPMDPGIFGQLGQVGAKNRRRERVPESTITMPEQIP